MTDRKFSRRDFLKFGLVALLDSALIILGGTAYSRFIEPCWITTTFLELTLPGLHPNFDGYRIAQISDIHIGTWMTRKRLMEAVERTNLQTPDLVVVTGDFVHRAPENYADDLIDPLSKLTPKDGILAVLGNHDHWTNPSLVREILMTTGIIDLSNRVHVLENRSTYLCIAGVDDIWERKDRLDIVLDVLPDESAAILLVHEPDYADFSAATGRFDLQLSGHTHGGQVVLPFLGPPILPTHGRKYPSGLYQTRGMYHYTNRGIGMIDPAIRFNCRPEITIFNLRSPVLG